MTAGTILCRRCGAPNEAGDQFCGTCGAFLEWEGEPLPAEGDGAAATEAAGADTADVADTAGAEPSTGTAPADQPSVGPSPGSADAAAPGVTCQSCGRANPAGRIFCQKCGTRLAGGEAASPVSAPAPSRPTAAIPPAAPAGTRPAVRSAGSGGLPGWLPIVVVLGLVAGVGGVVASILLRPPDVPSLASSAPGTPPATLTPTLPPPSPGDSGAASIDPSAGAAVSLTMTGATASSVVGNRPMFAPEMVIDGDLATCWQEGAVDEAGEWIEVTFEPSRLDYVVVYAGYQLSRDAYLANRRPKDVTVSVDGGAEQAFALSDTELPQRIDVGDVQAATRVRITIVTTYDPQATDYPGSPFDDTAISEIRAFGAPGG